MRKGSLGFEIDIEGLDWGDELGDPYLKVCNLA